MDSVAELFWSASIENITNGYRYVDSEESYVCLVCGKRFTEGMIYPQDTQLMDAKRAVKTHIADAHGSVFEFLLHLNKRYTGISETQKEIFTYLFQGLSDKEIAKKLGGGSPSTIRNHRFKMREKEKQAKVFLAMMQLLESREVPLKSSDELVMFHREATMVDDRYMMTQAERDKIRLIYIKDGKVKALPSKEKKKIVIFQYVMEKFESGRIYSEKEVNQIIQEVIDDYVTVRRYLIEYGFMDRKKDGSEYWVKDQ
ncbi:MAG: DUF2087 domain-containing protein [Bacillota bacterium]|nr:DUF2087 domain-containing protein [Bacillota bacterium]